LWDWTVAPLGTVYRKSLLEAEVPQEVVERRALHHEDDDVIDLLEVRGHYRLSRHYLAVKPKPALRADDFICVLNGAARFLEPAFERKGIAVSLLTVERARG
jgi:hypothetical protein